MAQMSPQEKQALIRSIIRAIAYAENGGKPNLDTPVAGKTGEMKSIFQFTPGTWKLYAKQVLGDENAPLNNDNEVNVVARKVEKWIDGGMTVGQIASMWNAGESKPNAYKENWKGVNEKYGVSYDTPAYAKKVMDYAKTFLDEEEKSNPQSQAPIPATPIPPQVNNTLPQLARQQSTPQSQSASVSMSQGKPLI